ncbi:MAG: tyrosine-type recombinase/integrase [Puniceicoccales bacterium]|nr:tyrosine-type recombinase/integrase [Puniceicoccales bacterium]
MDAYLLLKSQGWDALWAIYKVRKSKNDGEKKEENSEQKIVTIGDFISAIKERCVFRSNRTISWYISSLYRIISDTFIVGLGGKRCALATDKNKQRIERIHAINIAQLTPSIIEEWKNKTHKQKVDSDPEARAHASVTINSILRGCKNIFSKKILRALNFDKNFIPPFAEVAYLKEESHRYVTRFDATELIRRAKDELKPALPKSYIIFLLAIGAGLRRNEIDKLLWEQVDLERGIISIHATPYFVPKTRESSSDISLDSFIVDELKWFKEFSSEKLFVIESRKQPKPNTTYGHCRCIIDCKKSCKWLSQNCINARSSLHSLRKEFGAQICREYGLYMASRALRHSSYKMTESFYVDKTAAVVPEFFKKLSN